MKPIYISLSPNTFARDIWLAFRLLLQPWRWKNGRTSERFEHAMQDYLSINHAVSFDSGRSSWYAILKALNVQKGDEVLMQAFTCVVVANPVLWCGAQPVFVDIDESTFNMDLDDLARKITPKSKVLLVQHTFGLPQDMEHVMQIARKHNLRVVEDCAHALGSGIVFSTEQSAGSLQTGEKSEIRNPKSENTIRKTGTYGQAAFFSFGRDKVISGVHGGMAVTNSNEIGKKLLEFQQSLRYPSLTWIWQQLWHPILFVFIKKFYFTFGIGKILLVFFQKLGLLSKAVIPVEKKGGQPKVNPSRMPNALAELANEQFGKQCKSEAKLPPNKKVGWRLDEFNEQRRSLAHLYDEQLAGLKLHLPREPEVTKHIYMRYAVQTERAYELLLAARQEKMLLGDWYNPAIAPAGTDFATIGYEPGSCPVAEHVAARTLNLPTYPSMTQADAQRVIDFLRRQFVRERATTNA